MELTTLQVRDFIEELASDSPAPGGGSVAALCGALGAALTSMVASLTVGKEKYRENWEAMEEIQAKARKLGETFTRLIQEDTSAFNSYMKALKMPKETEEEKALRKEKMQEGLKEAAEVPLRTLEACRDLGDLALPAVAKGNSNAITDAATAALLALAAGKAAAYNIRINLGGIREESFVAQTENRVGELLAAITARAEEVEALVEKAF
ncbi:MAG TPA: cyclodeaminase/cyclohydrolase family protein [Synergistaceae bacterium]|nr:cyclodeaminase/cyclohydrolase family protein [Synergistaceae bacterium]HPQ38145.1 cyclodeaminase/cyclohydrolase family protein [Synergistaceae bacterium]